MPVIMKSFARLGRLKEAPASIGGEYFTTCNLFIQRTAVSKRDSRSFFIYFIYF